MFGILGAVLVFHFLIITQQIPYDKVWAGRLHSVEEMKRFEAFSILLNLFMLIIFIIKYKQLQRNIQHKVINILIWVFAAFFALNTIGNLFSKSMAELILGTLFTFTSVILCFFVVRKDK